MTEVTTEEVKAERKKPATQLTSDQIRETMKMAFEGKAPSEIAAILGGGVERNQTYRVISTFVKRCKSVIESDDATTEQKAKAQTHLDRIPAREFGATAGGGRVSVLTTTLNDILDNL